VLASETVFFRVPYFERDAWYSTPSKGCINLANLCYNDFKLGVPTFALGFALECYFDCWELTGSSMAWLGLGSKSWFALPWVDIVSGLRCSLRVSLSCWMPPSSLATRAIYDVLPRVCFRALDYRQGMGRLMENDVATMRDLGPTWLWFQIYALLKIKADERCSFIAWDDRDLRSIGLLPFVVVGADPLFSIWTMEFCSECDACDC